MTRRSPLQTSLLTTTALIGVTVLGLYITSAAQAAPVIIDSGNSPSGQVTLQNADTVTITGTGLISAGIGIFGSGGVIATSITNSGTIDGGNTGVLLLNSLTLSGGVINSGLIEGGSRGLYIYGTSSLAGGLTNSGTINGGSRGIYMSSGAVLSGGLTNSGIIESQITAFYIITGGTLTGGLTNSGTIAGSSVALGLASGTLTGGLTNSGLISGDRGISLNSGVIDSIVNLAGGTIEGTVGTAIGLSGLGANTNITLAGGRVIGHVTDSAPAGGYSRVTVSGAFATEGNFIVSDFDVASTGALTLGGTNTISSRGNMGVDGILVTTGTPTLNLNNTGNLFINNGGTLDVHGGFIVDNGGLTLSGGTIIVSSTGTLSEHINASGTSASIKNSGTIAVTVNNAINLYSDVISNGITNTGVISAGGNSAFYMGGNGSVNNGLTNSGTATGGTGLSIGSGNTLTGGFTNSGSVIGTANGVYLTSGRILGGVRNDGLIEGNTYSFYLGGGSTIDGGFTNTGTIAGNNFYALNLGGSTISGGLINSGTIQSNGTALRLTGGGFRILGGLTNSGVIQGSSHAIYGSGGSLAGGLTNSGTITGDQGFYFTGATISDFVNVAGGTVEGTGGTAIAFYGLSNNTNITLSGGRIIGNVLDSTPANGYSHVIADGAFTTEGNFTVSDLTVNATRSLTIDVGDTFTTYNNAVINGTLTFNVTDPANYGSLVVTNGTADLTNATLTVGLIGNAIQMGDEIRIINGNTALIGGPGATETSIADNSYLWDFVMFDGTAATAATNNTDLFIRAIQASAIIDAATTPNNQSAGEVLQSIAISTTDPQLSSIIQNLNNAPTQEAVNEILESTTPAMDTSVSESASAMAHQSIDLIQMRLSDLRGGSGVSSGSLTEGLSLWGQAYGQHITQDERDNIAGYDANIYGFVGGIDTDQLFENMTIGIALSYGNSAIKSDDANATKTDINSYQIGLYGDYQLPQNYFISGSAAYAYNDVSSIRYDVGAISGLNATADYKAKQYTAHAEAGRDFFVKSAGAPTLTPMLQATYINLSPDSYTETGAGGANLNVDTDTLEIFELGFEVKTQWDLKQASGSILSPSIHAGYRYDVIGDTVQNTSAFTGGGAAFETQGADPARGTANAGAGLKYQATNNWTLSAAYDFEYKQDYTAHAGVMRAGYKF